MLANQQHEVRPDIGKTGNERWNKLHVVKMISRYLKEIIDDERGQDTHRWWSGLGFVHFIDGVIKKQSDALLNSYSCISLQLSGRSSPEYFLFVEVQVGLT